jgi:hypothetical protein
LILNLINVIIIIYQIDMREDDSMKVLGILLALFVFLFCISSESFGNGVVKRGRGADEAITGGSATGPATASTEKGRLRSADASCKIVRRGQKPLSAILEDCVAYALDIPLAMLTPFVTAVTPIMDKLDYGCDNGYPRGSRK